MIRPINEIRQDIQDTRTENKAEMQVLLFELAQALTGFDIGDTITMNRDPSLSMLIKSMRGDDIQGTITHTNQSISIRESRGETKN